MMSQVPDIPRLYTAAAEWLSCLVFIAMLSPRGSKKKLAATAVCFLAAQAVFLEATGDVPMELWVPCMAAAFGLMLAFLFSCCEISLQEAVYFCGLAFVTAELMASLEWQMHCFLSVRTDLGMAGEAALLILFYGGICALVYKIFSQHMPESGKMGIRPREMWAAAIMVIAVFAVSNVSFLSLETPFNVDYGMDIMYIRTLVDGCGLAMLAAHFIQCGELRIRRELEAIQNVLDSQYRQYRQSKESIELLNYKYHDLKHQIAALRAEEDYKKREEFLDEMEKDISVYEAQSRTGNKVLDTVLTGKSLICARDGITMTCVADGTLLGFMDVKDICSVFGNALDNAIEYERGIEDREKRLIHVSVSAQKGFLFLRFENYYEGEELPETGLPETTKKNRDYHGYGLKSIRYTVQKYEGAVSIHTGDSWFELEILIPFPSEKKD